jgi:hypothetical protein
MCSDSPLLSVMLSLIQHAMNGILNQLVSFLHTFKDRFHREFLTLYTYGNKILERYNLGTSFTFHLKILLSTILLNIAVNILSKMNITVI